MSLHTAVQGNSAGRLHLRRDAAARTVSTPSRVHPRISINSMRILETGLALTAIATALLIGHH